MNYPKFYKMDELSKWALIAAEILLRMDGRYKYHDLDKSKVAIVLQTGNGSLDADKRYRLSIDAIPSPALFVYTLPNIMLGEICIRHGLKGEQVCMVEEIYNTVELSFIMNQFMEKDTTEGILAGWVNQKDNDHDICLYWIDKRTEKNKTSPELLTKYYKR